VSIFKKNQWNVDATRHVPCHGIAFRRLGTRLQGVCSLSLPLLPPLLPLSYLRVGIRHEIGAWAITNLDVTHGHTELPELF
jgi:hypothetical protein